MKVHKDLKELLDEYTSQYLIRCSSPKTNTLQEFIDDFASSNSLALGKPEPLAKNKASENSEQKINKCQADTDGECYHRLCPQILDNEPEKSGRHCPLDNIEDYEY